MTHAMSAALAAAAALALSLFDAASVTTIARTRVGMVVPESDAAVTIGSAEDLGPALPAAKAIVYANPAGGGAAGIHIARVIEKLDLADKLKSKTRLAAGGDATEVTLAQGEGAVGMTRVSEIVGKPGARLVTLPGWPPAFR